MVRRWWNRLGPWVVPTLLIVEVALVLSGRLTLGTAVIVIVGVELLLALVAGARIVAAVRVVRSSRTRGLTAGQQQKMGWRDSCHGRWRV